MPKICFKCKKEKNLREFYVHSQMRDGHLNKCKECTKKDVKKDRYKKIEYYKKYDRERANLPKRIKARKAYIKTKAGKSSCIKSKIKWIKNNPEKRKAHIIVGNALRNGLLKKEKCITCGSMESLAHHEDYNKPMNILWLCRKCHAMRHKFMNILGK
jgi:ribosomal protein S27AE